MKVFTAFLELLDTPGGHILCTLVIFLSGVDLYLHGKDLGREVVIGALASLWTLFQGKNRPINLQPQNVNQAETITIQKEASDKSTSDKS